MGPSSENPRYAHRQDSYSELLYRSRSAKHPLLQHRHARRYPKKRCSEAKLLGWARLCAGLRAAEPAQEGTGAGAGAGASASAGVALPPVRIVMVFRWCPPAGCLRAALGAGAGARPVMAPACRVRT